MTFRSASKAVMRLARQDNAARCWAAKLLERKPAKLAAVALANKTARCLGGADARRDLRGTNRRIVEVRLGSGPGPCRGGWREGGET